MPSDPQTLVFIPARGGSRGILRKNAQDVCGMPLLAYSILVAKAARSVGRVVVSTDDEGMAALAREYGAETPFLRPCGISGDRALICDAQDHALAQLKEQGYVPHFVITLYPTHPFRSAGLVDGLAQRLANGCASIVTVRLLEFSTRRYCVLEGGDRPRRVGQSWPPALPGLQAQRPYGLVVGQSLLPGARGVWVQPLRPGVECIDIDDPEDLKLAQAVVRNGAWRLEGACAG